MRKNKGFTLIELLAVIVILAVIATITIPLVIGIIDNARRSSYKQSLTSIFDATDLYLATSGFVDFPDEGINVRDETLNINHKDFTSGKIIKNEEGNFELERISNGLYCGNGTLDDVRVIQGSCDQLDTTPPINALATFNLITSSSVTIIGTADDLESGINGYQFSRDDGTTWTTKQPSNVYSFTGLANNTSYTFKVRAINNNLLSTESSGINVTTTDIPIPMYSIDTTNWVAQSTVTITYPARETGYVYQYSLDNAVTWDTVVSPAITKDIVFNDNGSVIARILDGTNEISGTNYTVTNIDKYDPSVQITVVGNPFNAGGWANSNFNLSIQGIDNESGVKSYTYCQTTSTSCAPATLVSASSGIVTIATESATNKVCAFSTDNGNNNSSVVCSNPYKLDKTVPVVGTINTSGTIGTNGWYTSNVTIGKVDGSDTLSGHASTVLSHTSITTETTGILVTLTTTDNAGNTGTINQLIKLDKTAPIITVNPVIVNLNVGVVYTETGISASDTFSGNLTPSIVRTGSVNTSVAGTYILTYNVSDAAGNAAVPQTRTVNVIQSVTNFGSTGAVQTFTAPVTGTYKLEVWGAQGGNNGGKGGYATGQMSLTANQQLSIIVGGAGSDYYGGVGTLNGSGGGGGGGGSFIRNGSTVLIAGGGGGGAAQGAGGAGGGTSGLNGSVGGSTGAGIGGTQSSGGSGGYAPNGDYGNSGGHGYGGGSKLRGNGTPFSTGGTGGGAGGFGGGGASATNYSDGTTGGGGGGGYYGGGAGGSYYTSSGGGGGSGYIGGVTGGQNLAGNQSFSAPGGGNETGHSGNGYARITFVSQ